MKKSIILAFSLTCVMGFSQTGLPQNIVIDGTFGISDPVDMVSRDLNNDNKKDILVKTYYTKLFWIKNKGNGFEHPELIYESPIENIKNFESADFDGDGKADVIFSTAKGLFLMKGTGSGGAATFTQPIQLSDQNIPLFRIGDIDGDGDQDIYIHQPISGTWLKNNGNGTFTSGNLIFYSLQKPDSVILKDLDNDNKPDLLVRINESRMLRWYKNDGSGNFTLKQTIDDFALGEFFDLGDVDGDGDLDIIHLFENGNVKQFKWYNNTNGLGTFSTSNLISNVPYNPYSVQNVKRYGVKMFDLDGDGKQDLVFCVYWDNKLSWKKNLGNGVFGPEQIISQNAIRVSKFDAADYNNDSKIDLISVSGGDSKVAWYEGVNGTGSFSAEKILTTDVSSLSSVETGDVDGDGDTDIVAVSGSKISWFKNTDGHADFSDQQKIIRNNLQLASDMSLADVDSDGDKDIIFKKQFDTSPTTSKYLWLENNGTGNFNVEHTIVDVGNNLGHLSTVGDFNGDGKKDFAYIGNATKLTVLLNTGNGNFGTPTEFLDTLTSFISSCKNADMDGDGDLDLVMAFSDGKIIWYENVNGLGSFTVKHTVASSLFGDIRLHIADLDGDGDNDISYVNDNGNKISWFENVDGQGNFGQEKIVGPGTVTGPYAIAAIDIDGDGRKDIVTNSKTQPKLRWYKNNGNGIFDNVPQLITNNVGLATSLLSTDLNGDGNPELVVGSKYLTGYKEDMISWFETGPAFQNKINGKVRYDIDNNGCDTNDTSASMMMVSTQSPTHKYSTFTNGNGEYSLMAKQGQYMTFVDAQLPNYTINPQNHSYNFVSTGVTDIADFCIAPNQVYKDLEMSIYPILAARPGFETKYRMVIANKGTQKVSGDIVFNYNGTKMSFLQASSPLVSQNNGSITFNYQDLSPFQTKTIELKFNVLPIPVNNIGEKLNINGVANVAGDVTPSNNEFTLNQNIVGSFDPNDITVLEGSQVLLQDADEYLHYIIRFQNTGNHFAEKVKIHNVLDSKLDGSTLVLEAFSHSNEAKITNENDIEFNFNAIYLPGSNDEANSHGFIAYKVKPKANVQMNDIINNVADIYFDYNPAIITNTVSTKIIDVVLGTNEKLTNTIKIYPNPTTGIINLNTKSVPEKVEVHNVLGQVVRTFRNVNRIDISDLAAGIYLLKIASKNESSVTVKIIKK
ncbi:T9SS type A sorting domain-containing protein [Chryseobacterium sp. MEBOG07]|uniref:T9SS type A sorting domain-containing protein n=1 Tax=Chryseobacterium sp. MEBOG07 TaxID=2879939 RepID=UPI001F357F1C|nr:T9SS type A sorting domain-containing protein [Chryseobacterium sp. MEBOG07]UKB81453.1 T9SS type A sorting domain-containing protein [Chryseobacterium sp. MEBOG07]